MYSFIPSIAESFESVFQAILLDYTQKQISYQDYISDFNGRLRKYFPCRDEWTPVDDALFTPNDLYRIPIEEARQMQLSSIQFAFDYHYRNNEFYHSFCEKRGVTPADIRTSDDLLKIPLIPDTFYKSYHNGRDFATWLGNLYTGKLPDITLKQKNPGQDQVIEAFNQAGLEVTYSSGTSGRHTFIPRDHRTFCNQQYALAKSTLAMSCGRWIYDSNAYLMMPDPRINSIFAGRSSNIMFDIVGTAQVAIKRKIPLSMLSMMMGGQSGLKRIVARYVSHYQTGKIIDRTIKWLVSRENSPDFTFILGAPFLIHAVLQRLKQEGKSFCFGERGGVVTGGGWKVHEKERLTLEAFRAEVKDILGIPERYCLDVYGMVEGNGWMIQCPEGHFLHVPYSYYKPLVLDESLSPVPNGNWGRFAFLDASALSYPGFILTGDYVRLLERCPVCDRPGPVLEPEVRRAAGQDERGCAGEVRRMFLIDQR